MDVESSLRELVARLEKAFGDRLVSAVLYGSAAAGDYQPKFSDLNVLCVLREISTGELAAAAPIFQWWRERGNPAPLLLSEAEVTSATDCFPIEFSDIRQHHRILCGRDVASGLTIDRIFYRAQVEHELRAKLLRLRQKAAGALRDEDLLRRLLADSVSTFCVLIRHAMALAGAEPPVSRRETVQRARDLFGMDPQPFEALLDLREQRVKPAALDPVGLLPRYIAGIAAVIAAVDRMER